MNGDQNMKVNLRAMHLSPLGLLVVLLTSLPGYLLITLAMFLNFKVFTALVGSLMLGHLLDRGLTRALTEQAENAFEVMQRQAIEMINAAMPGFGETVVNPSIRRLTGMLGVLVAQWYSQNAAIIAGLVFIVAVYVEYVEQHRSPMSILWGVLTGGLAGAPFAYWLFLL
jgi:hypothetical protein